MLICARLVYVSVTEQCYDSECFDLFCPSVYLHRLATLFKQEHWISSIQGPHVSCPALLQHNLTLPIALYQVNKLRTYFQFSGIIEWEATWRQLVLLIWRARGQQYTDNSTLTRISSGSMHPINQQSAKEGQTIL